MSIFWVEAVSRVLAMGLGMDRTRRSASSVGGYIRLGFD